MVDVFQSAADLSSLLIGINCLVAGLIIGVLVGAILSMQMLWTHDPFNFSIQFALQILLCSLRCEMDSVHTLQQIETIRLADPSLASTPPIIKNTQNDPIILPRASLAYGMFRALGTREETTKTQWYAEGDHMYALEQPLENYAQQGYLVSL